MLALYDMADKTEDEVKAHIAAGYCDLWGDKGADGVTEAKLAEELGAYNILIAAELEGSYEGQSWFLLRRKVDGKLFSNYASHCSCFGYEDQWDPEETDLAYLTSDRFRFNIYDRSTDAPETVEARNKVAAKIAEIASES
jgi:hypothetical protein